jgi:hypothetical protein
MTLASNGRYTPPVSHRYHFLSSLVINSVHGQQWLTIDMAINNITRYIFTHKAKAKFAWKRSGLIHPTRTKANKSRITSPMFGRHPTLVQTANGAQIYTDMLPTLFG